MDWSVRHRTQQCYKLTIKSHIRRWTGISPVSFIPARYYRYPEYLEYELINHMRRYLFFFGRRKIYMKLVSVCAVLFRNQGAYDSLIHIPSRVFRHFVETLQNHWFKCQKKKKNSEAVPGYILELNVYFTQSFKILCRRRLLILRELGVRDHF